MSEKVHCDTHGESEKAYVCSHLLGEATGLGFNRGDPTADNPFPDAWCDNCEIIRAAHDGWNDGSEKLTSISLLCSGCYERARIRNERPTVTLADLASLRWKCSDCDEWHNGPCLDFGFSAPAYWHGDLVGQEGSFLNADICVVENRNFFVRGLIHLPILGTGESFRWGVWGSLSHDNFKKITEKWDDADRSDLPPMFSWLSTQLPEYPDTRNLEMYAHIQECGERPHFRLERCDHPLAVEYHQGITPERVRDLMRKLLRETDPV